MLPFQQSYQLTNFCIWMFKAPLWIKASSISLPMANLRFDFLASAITVLLMWWRLALPPLPFILCRGSNSMFEGLMNILLFLCSICSWRVGTSTPVNESPSRVINSAGILTHFFYSFNYWGWEICPNIWWWKKNFFIVFLSKRVLVSSKDQFLFDTLKKKDSDPDPDPDPNFHLFKFLH